MLDDNSKYASEYPLPGGVESYFDTLVRFLRYIRDSKAKLDDLSRWMFDTFPNASGQIAVNGYIATVNRLGFWSEQEEFCRLTPEGVEIVNAADSDLPEAREMVLKIKYAKFSGYDLLLRWFEEGPQTLDGLHERLKGALHVNWESKNQTNFRVNWLRSLGYVLKEGRQYQFTPQGSIVARKISELNEQPFQGPKKHPVLAEVTLSATLTGEANRIADRLDRASIAGGDGKEFESATESAFSFLGFDTQLISGANNPDVLATATMGEKTYRILIDSKSRNSGVIQQNDVNLHALEKQRKNSGAKYTVVVAQAFSEGNLEEFAVQNEVRLITTGELRELLLAHALSVIPLDLFLPLFEGGGATDESILSDLLTAAESKSDVMSLAGKVYSAVRENQDKDGAIDANSLFYILKGEQSLSTIKLTIEFLKSDLIGALAETERRSLHTRISASTLDRKLTQISRSMGLKGLPEKP